MSRVRLTSVCAVRLGQYRPTLSWSHCNLSVKLLYLPPTLTGWLLFGLAAVTPIFRFSWGQLGRGSQFPRGWSFVPNSTNAAHARFSVAFTLLEVRRDVPIILVTKQIPHNGHGKRADDARIVLHKSNRL